MRWGPAPEGYERLNLSEVPFPNVAATVYVCKNCGAMVGNTIQHDRHHNAFGSVIVVEPKPWEKD